MLALITLSYREQQCILLRGRGATLQEVATSLNISIRKAMYVSKHALGNWACAICIFLVVTKTLHGS